MRKFARWNMFAAMVVALTIALGGQGVWGFICIWTQSVIGQSFGSQLSESLEITRDGRTLVRNIQRVDGVWRYTYRTLDGQDVSDATVNTAATVHVLAAPLRPQSLNWAQRAVGFADTQSWPAYWFLIRDAKVPGNAYFTIYDGQSRQLLGYFGPHGFRPDPPLSNEQFLNVPPGGCEVIYTSAPYSGGSLWNRATAVYIVGNGSLWLIDVEKRSIRAIPISGEPVAVAWTDEPEYFGGGFDAADFDPTRNRVVVRMRDQIALLSPHGEMRRSLPIPADVREREFDFYETKAGDVILTAYRSIGHADVYWIGDSAGAERHEEVRLAGMQSADDNPLTAWYTAAVLPAPVFLNAGYVMEAAQQVASGVSATMAESLAKAVNRDWPAILTVWTLSALLAGVCYRHHQRCADRGGAAWALFVFLMGVPGAIGYWLHRQWPVTERCAHCGATAPRDRDGCLVCAAEFPAPELKGIEVFA
jgi:hypothetical protein